jgi:AraC family transcriptional regulator, transcriptional activator of the genes for pyochelin and ferripyochelin receptors
MQTMLVPSPAVTRELSISESMAAWHDMICRRSAPAASERADNGRCRFLEAEIDPGVGSGTLDLVSFDDDFILMAMRGSFHQPLCYRVAGEGWTRLHFRRSARISMAFDGIGQTELEGPLCQLLHQPYQVGDFEHVEPGVQLEWVTLLVRPRLLVERFRLDSMNLSDPVRRLASGADDFLLQNWPLAPQMSQAMSQMFATRFSGDLRSVYLEAKATELVCLLASAMHVRAHDPLRVRLTAYDVDCLHAARSILSDSFAEPPGIEELSRRLGINRNKLTYGFKHLFDATISEFCAERRLQRAWELLHETRLPIALIGEQVGYTRSAAFSAAFRSHFGMTPRQARRDTSIGVAESEIVIATT